MNSAESEALERSESSDGPSISSSHPQYNYEYISDDELRRNHPINVERIQQIEESMTGVRDVINKYGNTPFPSLDPNDIDANGWKIDHDSPWSDVSAAVKEIVSAGEKMKRVLEHGNTQNFSDVKDTKWWEPYLSQDTKSNDSIKYSDPIEQEDALTPEEEQQFEQVHMEWATNAFAEELEALRNGTLEQKFGSKKMKVNDLELDPTEHSFVVAKKYSSTTDNSDSMREEVDVQVLASMLQSGGRLFSNVEKKMLLRARQRGNLPRIEKLESLPIHEMRKHASRATK